MNVMTICHADDWVGTHLKRFVYYAMSKIPDVKLYLLVPTTGRDDPAIRAHLEKVGPDYFRDIKFVKKQEIQGRLLYYDLLRSSLLDIFGLDEGLYADPDIDILSDLTHLETTAPAADMLWVPNVLPMDLVPKALQRNGMDPEGPYMEEGFIYMRRSLKDDCEHVLNHKSIDFNSFAPGMEMWNIVCRTMNCYMLPQEYNVTSWGHKYFGKAHSIHFTGPLPKQWRMNISYSTKLPRTMLVEPTPVEYPEIDL